MKAVLPDATTRMNLEDMTINDISQAEENKYCPVTHAWNWKKIETYRNEK